MTSLIIDKPSLSGKLFYSLDKFSHNIKFFITRHNNSTEVIFIMIYLTIQLSLIVLIRQTIVAVMILFLTFAMAIERIVLKFRSREAEIKSSNLEKSFIRLERLTLNENIKSKKQS